MECGLSHIFLLPLQICSCAHTHCLVFVNIQHALININGCSFLCMEKFNDAILLCTHFHVRCHFIRNLHKKVENSYLPCYRLSFCLKSHAFFSPLQSLSPAFQDIFFYHLLFVFAKCRLGQMWGRVL